MAHTRFLYLNSILLSPAINPGLTIDVLTLDDNDADITNGTPNYDEIDQAFTAHNLPAPPLALVTELEIVPNTIVGGGTAVGTVSLRSSAGVGGAPVTLTSNDPNAQVPPSVTVAQGETSASFDITTTPGAVGVATISATRLSSTKQATLTMVMANVESMSVTPNTVTGGTNAFLTVRLNGAAPGPNGVDVSLTTGSGAISLPPTVTVDPGNLEQTFVIPTNAVDVTTGVTIFGQVGAGDIRTATFTVAVPIAASVSVAPNPVQGGTNTTGTVNLSGPAGPSGVPVQLSTSASTVATTPVSVIVAPGSTSANFTINTSTVANVALVSIRASRYNVATAPLTVLPVPMTSLTLSPTTVKGGKKSTGTVVIASALSVPYTVELSSSNEAIATVPFTVTILPGKTSAKFFVTTVRPPANTVVTITATKGLQQLSQNLTVRR
jgi:hypothetical protein